MKQITIHWTEIRVVIVPDECPTSDLIDMERYIIKNIDKSWRGTEDTKHTIVENSDSRDYEIVEVKEDYTNEPF